MGHASPLIAVVFNPTARGERAALLRRQLALVARDSLWLPTSGPGDAVRLAREAGEAGADVLVAAGGDGTVNEVLNGICGLPPGRRPSLGVIPMGTVNVFARELGISCRVDEAWQTVLEGRCRVMDVAAAAHRGGVRRFVQLAGAGLDAEAIRRVRWRLKKVAGPLAYLWAGLGTVARRLPLIELDGGRHRMSAEVVMVGNGRLYGGGFAVFPDAAPDDGLLDIAAMRKANLISLARAATAAWHGRSARLPGVQHFQAATLELRSASTGARFQVEGDDAGELPVRLDVEARALRVLSGMSKGGAVRA